MCVMSGAMVSGMALCLVRGLTMCAPDARYGVHSGVYGANLSSEVAFPQVRRGVVG